MVKGITAFVEAFGTDKKDVSPRSKSPVNPASTNHLSTGGAAAANGSSSPSKQPSMAATAPTVVDLHSLIEDYCWNQFKELQEVSKKNEYKGLEREDVTFEVNLRKLQVVHSDPDYQNFTPGGTKPYSLFKTEFTNDTGRPQAYSFKTERTTESVCTVFKEQGYMFGMESELSLKTPCEILEAKAGFKHELNFSKGSENSVAETLTWGVDSTIMVPANCRTSAELVVEEMNYSGRFTAYTYLSGTISVSIIRRKDGALILPMATNILEIIRETLSSNSKTGKDLKSMCQIEGRAVKMMTKGSCNFQFATKQKVLINEELLGETRSIGSQTDSPHFEPKSPSPSNHHADSNVTPHISYSGSASPSANLLSQNSPFRNYTHSDYHFHSRFGERR